MIRCYTYSVFSAYSFNTVSFYRPGYYYTVRLGDHNRQVKEGTEEDIPGKRVIVHPDYNKIPIDSDIALIQLSRPATMNARVKTVCLPSQDEIVPTSSKCFITGLFQFEKQIFMVVVQCSPGISNR